MGANPWLDRHVRGNRRGADAVLVPEELHDLEQVASLVRAHGRSAGATRWWWSPRASSPAGTEIAKPVDVFGFERLGGVSALIARLEEMTGFEARVTVLETSSAAGRPARPTDPRSRLGVAAADLVASEGFGRMVGMWARRSSTCLEEACATLRGCPNRSSTSRARCRRSDLPARRDRIRRVPRQPISSASVGA